MLHRIAPRGKADFSFHQQRFLFGLAFRGGRRTTATVVSHREWRLNSAYAVLCVSKPSAHGVELSTVILTSYNCGRCSRWNPNENPEHPNAHYSTPFHPMWYGLRRGLGRARGGEAHRRTPLAYRRATSGHFFSFGLPAVLYAMRKPSACDARCDFTVACDRTRRERGRKPTLTTR